MNLESVENSNWHHSKTAKHDHNCRVGGVMVWEGIILNEHTEIYILQRGSN